MPYELTVEDGSKSWKDTFRTERRSRLGRDIISYFDVLLLLLMSTVKFVMMILGSKLVVVLLCIYIYTAHRRAPHSK